MTYPNHARGPISTPKLEAARYTLSPKYILCKLFPTYPSPDPSTTTHRLPKRTTSSYHIPSSRFQGRSLESISVNIVTTNLQSVPCTSYRQDSVCHPAITPSTFDNNTSLHFWLPFHPPHSSSTPTYIPSIMAADPRALLQKADKAAQGATGGFSLFGGRTEKWENAADLYNQAGNAFRMQKQSNHHASLPPSMTTQQTRLTPHNPRL